MSKNYELVQSLVRERGLASSAPPAAPAPVRLPRLPMNAGARAEIERLVRSLFTPADGPAPRVVVFASTEGENRCTALCAHVGDILGARIVGSVCVVDANLHAPYLHQYFRKNNKSGLVDLILDPEKPLLDSILMVRESNLYILSTGPTDLQNPELLRMETLRRRVAELRQHFDYVLVAGPPVPRYPDALNLGQLADGIVLSVKKYATRRDVACQVREQLDYAGIQVLGAVLE